MKIEFDNPAYGDWLRDWLEDNPVEETIVVNLVHLCTTAEIVLTSEPQFSLFTTVNAELLSTYPVETGYLLPEDSAFDCGPFMYTISPNTNFIKYNKLA